MKLLAIDTATKIAGAAVINESGVLAESWLNTGKTHSQKFLPMLESMLKNADITLEEIDCFAVTVGPGSFTGVRIGLATLKGLIQVLEKPAVSVVTLDALCRNLSGSTELICPVLDARKNEVYTALYREEAGVITRISPYRAVSPTQLLSELKLQNEKITFLGDGVFVHRETIQDELGSNAAFAEYTRNFLRPSEVAFIGWEKFIQGETVGINDISPLYLRLSEAEVKWAEAHGGCGCDG
ncbi:MAG: tRNA (adenosine(37)-N6)-threonylcarbamoyltransferase complex dimerization subunit type 1 TsaB [Desulfitobacteriaceae bacterium]|nr:tRNA (adenosine(37)-N6)-threonylcarbamoyltransferase complex dimerization subunit type 1 TsaB [Desulfitobacteriaceae bacterium]